MAAEQHESRRRTRRRVSRPSEADNIDRSVDTPRHGFADDSVSVDGERVVPIDDDGGDEPGGVEFWREQFPPHHGE